jgi:uncharacterized protein (TIGR03000 family)
MDSLADPVLSHGMEVNPMYTVVVLAALGGSVDLPDCGHRRHGCCGGDCYGGCYGSCYGGGYGGCYGGWGGCHGGYGGCYGGGGYGGGYAWGGYGSSYAPYAYNYGNTMTYPYDRNYSSGYYDQNGQAVPNWSDVNRRNNERLNSPQQRNEDALFNNQPGRTNQLTPAPQGGTSPQTPNRSGDQNRPMPQTRGTTEQAATIVVTLPANARLSIEGQPTQSTAGQRVFVSPPLERGKTYTYNLKAEFDRNGQKSTATQNVDVRAGETSRVAMTMPASDANR